MALDAGLEVDVDPDGLGQACHRQAGPRQTHAAAIGCELPHVLQVVLDRHRLLMPVASEEGCYGRS